ncbi:unnamed protein product, partial [marine sediment metagenome]
APLHMMGVSLLFQEDLEDAVRHFLLAYIEDILSARIWEEGLADRAPAGRMLADIFRIDPFLLRYIKEIAEPIKMEGIDENITDSEEILKNARRLHEKRSGLPRAKTKTLLGLCSVRPKLSSKQSIDRIPSSWEKRVFIGGNYDYMATLMEIKEIVLNLGYEPIVAFDYGIPEDKIHHHDLMLLHDCKYAIFDVSQSDGHLMEIERTRDYNVKTLLVYSARNDKKQPPSSMSAMIQTLGIQMSGYLNLRELRQLISGFLPVVAST